SFTVSVWTQKSQMKTDHIFSMPAVTDYHWSGGSMFLLPEGSVASPTLKFFVKDKTAEKWFECVCANSPLGIYIGQWHHLALVYDGTTSTMTLYIYGQPHAFKSEWTNHRNVVLEPSKITALTSGARPQEFTEDQIANNGDDWLKNSYTGGIDQFRMYSTALTAAEVQTLFTRKR